MFAGDTMDNAPQKKYAPIPHQVEEAARCAVDSAFHVHMKIGQGLLERNYEKFMEIELKKRGCTVKRQVKIKIKYDGVEYEDEYYVIDMLVNDCLALELKVVEKILPVHRYQLLTYLKHSDLRLGLLINFNTANIGEGISRVIN
jgi:GxxExxY protein